MWPLLDPHRQDCSCTTDASVVKMFKIQYSTHQHLTVTCDEDDSVGVNLKANYGGIFLVSIFPSVAETPLDTSTTFQNPAGRHPMLDARCRLLHADTEEYNPDHTSLRISPLVGTRSRSRAALRKAMVVKRQRRGLESHFMLHIRSQQRRTNDACDKFLHMRDRI